ncbi:ABC transporter permease [Cohnella lubricantis]|uniref:Transport permease protein n=1 Tax=Cohnella lubricantis TaxID=2163172 RepID=A0A841TCU2_9BACL|nr:ABC transporter permease [Cohnella lubricantis]MBB6677060.1 ABC transporter permease [Cohnella lubricantis]MBP2118907.1 ABC-2 type transport system permease protein [Cohnella lubricantis]
MNNIIWIASHSLRRTFRKRSSWIVYFGLPVATILLSMFIYGSSNEGTLRVGVVNQDGSKALTADTVHFLEGLNNVEITMTDDASLNGDIASGKLDSGLIFEAGFADSVRDGQPAHLRIVSAKGAAVTSYVKAMMEEYVGNVASIGRATADNPASFDAIYADYKQSGFKLDAESLKDTSHTKGVTYQSLGFLIMFLLFSAVNMSNLIIKEREDRTFLRLLSSPVTARGYVFAHVLVAFIIQLLQIAFTLFMMKNVFHIDSGVPYGEMLATMLLFSLTAIGLALLITAFAKNSKNAGAMQNLIITPSCLLAGCFFPAEIMPDTVRHISNFLPQRWILDTITKLQEGQTLGSLGLNVAILVGFAAAFTLVAIFRFSRNNDTRQFI